MKASKNLRMCKQFFVLSEESSRPKDVILQILFHLPIYHNLFKNKTASIETVRWKCIINNLVCLIHNKILIINHLRILIPKFSLINILTKYVVIRLTQILIQVHQSSQVLIIVMIFIPNLPINFLPERFLKSLKNQTKQRKCLTN